MQRMTPARRAALYDRVERWTEAPMLLLGFVFLLVIAGPLILDLLTTLDPQFPLSLSTGQQQALATIDWLIWACFAAELVVKTYLSPKRLAYLRTHWLDVIIVLLPLLRFLRFLRFVRIAQTAQMSLRFRLLSARLLRAMLLLRVAQYLGRRVRFAERLERLLPQNKVTLDQRALLLFLSAAASERSARDEAEARLAKTLAQARTTVEQLLPPASLDIPGRYPGRVAGRRHLTPHIGGDHFDYHLRADGQLALLMCRVAGDGATAALRIAAVKAAWLAVVEQQAEPAAVLAILNEAVIASAATTDDVTTCWFALYNPTTATLSHSNAGHTPPALIRPIQRSLEWLDAAPGPALGAQREVEYAEWRQHLAPGARLVLHSDGVAAPPLPQLPSNGEETTRSTRGTIAARLTELVEADTSLLLNTLVSPADPVSGAVEPLADDLTVVVLALAPSSSYTRQGMSTALAVRRYGTATRRRSLNLAASVWSRLRSLQRSVIKRF